MTLSRWSHSSKCSHFFTAMFVFVKAKFYSFPTYRAGKNDVVAMVTLIIVFPETISIGVLAIETNSLYRKEPHRLDGHTHQSVPRDPAHGILQCSPHCQCMCLEENYNIVSYKSD